MYWGQNKPKYKNCEEDHVYAKLDHPTLLVSVEISENFSDINKMLPSNKPAVLWENTYILHASMESIYQTHL